MPVTMGGKEVKRGDLLPALGFLSVYKGSFFTPDAVKERARLATSHATVGKMFRRAVAADTRYNGLRLERRYRMNEAGTDELAVYGLIAEDALF